MKIGIIYAVYINSDDSKLCHSFLDYGAGGTETSIIQMAEKLAEQNNEVDIICTCDEHEEYGVKYLSAKRIIEILSSNKYDFILVECYYRNVVKLIEKYNTTESVILLHSLNGFNDHDCFDKNSGQNLSRYESDDDMKSPLVKKFIAISDSQKGEYIRFNGIPEEKISIIPYGIDAKLFEGIDVNHEVDHSILWSSSYFRGAKILIDFVAPAVRQLIPDFKVKMCTPVYCKDVMTHTQSVEMLGHLSKTALVEEMRKHACWWYPSTFNETFCVTSVEAALCGNELSLPLVNGPATMFRDFRQHVAMYNDISNPELFIKESATRIFNSIVHYHDPDRVEIRRKIQRHLLDKYSWDVIAPKFLEVAGK